MNKIYPKYHWMDEEIIGDVEWVCECGHAHTQETMTIYDYITCEKCNKKWRMHQAVWLEPEVQNSVTG